MVEVKICVGSSCHLKGAPEVVEKFKSLIKEKELEDTINLKASFCQNNCTTGVNITIDGTKISNVSGNDVEKLIDQKISGEIVNENT